MFFDDSVIDAGVSSQGLAKRSSPQSRDREARHLAKLVSRGEAALASFPGSANAWFPSPTVLLRNVATDGMLVV